MLPTSQEEAGVGVTETAEYRWKESVEQKMLVLAYKHFAGS
jgi:hypothetical protein